MFFVTVTLVIVDIRGDFIQRIRPINFVDASQNVRIIAQANFVLNTPFAFIRTIGIRSLKKENFISQRTIDTLLQTIKQYKNNKSSKPSL